MASSTVLEMFGHFVFSFTRGVTDHYSPEEPEFTAESFGYNPLENTGREWYYHPVDELIYQEYSDREAISLSYLASNRLDVEVINACLPQEEEEPVGGQEDKIRAMAWKRFRPPALQTACESMFIGAMISLLAASFIAAIFLSLSYVSFETLSISCTNGSVNGSFPVRMQWVRTISEEIASAFYYFWSFFNVLLLFRPHQLTGVKRKLVLTSSVSYCLESAYRLSLQAVGKPYYMLPEIYRAPMNTFFLSSVALLFYLIVRHLVRSPWKKVVFLICKMVVPFCLSFLIGQLVAGFLYPAYNKHDKDGKLLIAIFAPLAGVALKVISRIGVQRLWNITHPGYSYVLLVPLYFGSAVTFRVLQADLANGKLKESLPPIAVLGIVHGAAEVIERSTMVAIDHVCHQIWKRRLSPWGSFRTPRRERLMADIAIISMLFESTAIVCANGYLYLYQFIHLEHSSPLKLLEEFAITTAVPLLIEWFFSSVSLAIETRYQNMPVMAVWRRRWKRHVLVAIVNVLPLAMWTSATMLVIVRGRFPNITNNFCKMPFT